MEHHKRIAIGPVESPEWVRDAVIAGGGEVVEPADATAVVWTAARNPQGLKDLLDELPKQKKKVHTILFDGIITNRLVEAAEGKGVEVIIGVKKGQITPQKVKTYTM